VDEIDEQLLREAEQLTVIIRQHQEAVKRVGENRRDKIRALRDRRVPFRVIASACGVTDQALFADLRKHPAP